MSVALDTYVQPKTARTPRSVVESSVIATLRGSDPNEIYVMSSHYDDCNGDCTNGSRVAPGADDNASSVAAVLEAARVMAATAFRATIIFACFDGEELGLWGSDHYARELAAAHAPVVWRAQQRHHRQLRRRRRTPASRKSFGSLAKGCRPVRKSRASISSVRRTIRRRASFPALSPSRSRHTFPAFPCGRSFARTASCAGAIKSRSKTPVTAAVRFVEAHENFTHQHQNVRVEDGVQYGDLPQLHGLAVSSQDHASERRCAWRRSRWVRHRRGTCKWCCANWVTTRPCGGRPQPERPDMRSCGARAMRRNGSTQKASVTSPKPRLPFRRTTISSAFAASTRTVCAVRPPTPRQCASRATLQQPRAFLRCRRGCAQSKRTSLHFATARARRRARTFRGNRRRTRLGLASRASSKLRTGGPARNLKSTIDSDCTTEYGKPSRLKIARNPSASGARSASIVA